VKHHYFIVGPSTAGLRQQQALYASLWISEPTSWAAFHMGAVKMDEE
jgi:hypothetical protein